MVFVSTPLGSCGSRKSGQKTPRILVHQKGSVVAPQTPRIRISLVFPDTCHKNPGCVRQQHPENGQEYVVLVSTPLGSCGSRKSGQKTPRILVHQKGSVVAQHTPRVRVSLVFPDPCHKNPWCVRRQYPENGQEYVVFVSTPLGGCGSRKSGQKTPRILVHQRVVSWHSTQGVLLLYPCRNSSRVSLSLSLSLSIGRQPVWRDRTAAPDHRSFWGVDGRTVLPLLAVLVSEKPSWSVLLYRLEDEGGSTIESLTRTNKQHKQRSRSARQMCRRPSRGGGAAASDCLGDVPHDSWVSCFSWPFCIVVVTMPKRQGTTDTRLVIVVVDDVVVAGRQKKIFWIHYA